MRERDRADECSNGWDARSSWCSRALAADAHLLNEGNFPPGGGKECREQFAGRAASQDNYIDVLHCLLLARI